MIDFNKAFPQDFQTGTVTTVTGVKRPRLQTWIENGWIVPSAQIGDGPGRPNLFDLNDLCWIAAFKMITEVGLPRKTAGSIFSCLKDLSKLSLHETDNDGEFHEYNIIFFISSDTKKMASIWSETDFSLDKIIADSGIQNYKYCFVFNIKDDIDHIFKELTKLYL